jgi:hypothetical protein
MQVISAVNDLMQFTLDLNACAHDTQIVDLGIYCANGTRRAWNPTIWAFVVPVLQEELGILIWPLVQVLPQLAREARLGSGHLLCQRHRKNLESESGLCCKLFCQTLAPEARIGSGSVRCGARRGSTRGQPCVLRGLQLP